MATKRHRPLCLLNDDPDVLASRDRVAAHRGGISSGWNDMVSRGVHAIAYRPGSDECRTSISAAGFVPGSRRVIPIRDGNDAIGHAARSTSRGISTAGAGLVPVSSEE